MKKAYWNAANSRPRRLGYGVVLLALVVQLCACAAQVVPQPERVDGPVTLEEAMQTYAASADRASLLGAISLLETYAARHPADYRSRAQLANAYTLLGAAYSHGAAKEAAYTTAMQHGLAAMLTVPGFARVYRDEGAGFESALQRLDARHLEAMEFWKTALFYQFRESSGLLGKILRYRQLRQAVAVMDRMAEIDPEAMWGNNLFSRGIYFLAQPEFAGGDRNKSAAFLARAAGVNARNIIPRWGRAKYYAVAMQDRALFESDLRWVVNQSLEKLVGYPHWNRYLQREARQLLNQADDYFPKAQG